MNVEEYEEQRAMLVRQWARTVNIRERKRLDTKIARLDYAFDRELMDLHGIRRPREHSSHTLQSFGVV